jgi:putative ABC transport system permease protein
MAKAFFDGQDPIGKRIFFDFEVQRERLQGFPAPRYEIVGIVGDVMPALDAPIRPSLYRPLLDLGFNGVTILSHTAVEPLSAAYSIANAVHGLDPGLPVAQVRTVDDLVGRSTSDRRFTLLLFVGFAALAMALAAIGLYGVVPYAVSQRTAEIGVRMALGATGADVSRLVVMQGLRPALAGVGIAIVAAFFGVRLLRTLLFGVTALDPLTFANRAAGAPGGRGAGVLRPALRAVRLDPTRALRGG